jgi:hypothetical protein
MVEEPRYLVLTKSFVVTSLFETGSEVAFSGLPGSSLLPLNDSARAAAVTYDNLNKVSQPVRDLARARAIAKLNAPQQARARSALHLLAQAKAAALVSNG